MARWQGLFEVLRQMDLVDPARGGRQKSIIFKPWETWETLLIDSWPASPELGLNVADSLESELLPLNEAIASEQKTQLLQMIQDFSTVFSTSLGRTYAI